MKTYQLILLIFLLVSACQQETSDATSWSSKNSKKGGEEIRSDIQLSPDPPVNSPNNGIIDGVYLKEEIPTKRVIPYKVLRESNSAKSGSIATFQPDQAGKLTSGEQNDLSEWEFWDDLTSNQLFEQSILWKLLPAQRMSFLVKNKQGVPIQNAKIQLYGKFEDSDPDLLLWSGVTDNTGFAFLFAGLNRKDKYMMVTRAEISNNGELVNLDTIQPYDQGINSVTLDVECSKKQIADIAFVVDATGSMGDEIDFLKQDLLDIIQSTSELYPDAEINLASLFYRCAENKFVTKHSDFSSDHKKTFNFILKQDADEGGQEVVEQALDEAINDLSWRENATTKLIFLVLDEAPGKSEEINEKMKAAYEDAARKGIKIIPCVASGTGHADDRNLEYLMRVGAIATNGTYVFFTNDSGIGNNHTTPLVKSVEVKTLNALLKNIILENLYLAPCEVKDGSRPLYSDEQNNAGEEITNILDSLSLLGSDSLISKLLPYTEFESENDLNENRPLTNMDTSALLNDYQKEIVSMNVYSLPAFSDITIDVSNIPDSYLLFDGHGRVIRHETTIDSKIFTVDLLQLPRGQYFLHVTIGETILRSRIPKL